MNHLLRELAPVSGEAWGAIDEEASRTLRHFLAARKVVDFSGPHGWSHSAETLGRVDALGLSVDILVNNAGLSTVGPVAKSVPEKELNLVEVDVAAVVDMCSRFLPGMVDRGRGAVLNVASVGAFGPVPGQASYGAAKAFVLSYTEALRGELRGSGVTATALCPGPVKTGFGEAAGISDEDAEAALPRVMWKTADEVALAGINGLAAGKGVVVPGGINRVAGVFYRLAPRDLILPFLARSHPGLKDA